VNSRYVYFLVHGVRPPRRSPRRWSPRKPARNFRYRAWIRSLPSAVSGAMGCEAAHTGQDGGLSMKASDYSCIPLTPIEHLRYHAIGRDAFEKLHGIDCAEISRKLAATWFRFSKEVK
jgi:hypothetical protein